MTDAGVVALGHGCGQLQSINLSSCWKVTDAGNIALGHGCGQLQSINLACCSKVTDAGVVALRHGCDQLQSIIRQDGHEMTHDDDGGDDIDYDVVDYVRSTASHLKISCLEFEDKNCIRNLNSFNEIFNFHN